MIGDKPLPKGHFLFLGGLPDAVTPKDIQDVIVARTGVLLDLDRIAIDDKDTRFPTRRAMLSLTRQHIAHIIRWALSEDKICGEPFVVTIPAKQD